MRFGIVVAAGRGQRMGFQKQFLDLAGQPMWVRSVDGLIQGGIEFTVVVCQAESISQMKESISWAGWRKNVAFCQGGSTRYESVCAGLKVIDAVRAKSGSSADGETSDIVAIHDAARPFVSKFDVDAVCSAAEETGAALLGESCRDTVKQVQDGRVVKTVDRSSLFLAQTPQVMNLAIAKQVYVEIEHQPTDDMTLLEQRGIAVTPVFSTSFNGKVTTPVDLRFAHWLAMEQWGGK